MLAPIISSLIRLDRAGVDMTVHTTWQPLADSYDINDNGKLDPRERRALPDHAFAFPDQRELPLVDAELTRAAMEELHQFHSASLEERELAANNIRAAARHFGIAMTELTP
jgi:hypothetical protein